MSSKNLNEIADEIRAIVSKRDEIDARIRLLREESRKCDTDLAPLFLAYYGVQRGDKVSVTRRSKWDDTKNEYCDVIKVYEVFCVDHSSSLTSDIPRPWLIGFEIRKDGTPSKRKVTLYSDWIKLEEAWHLPAVGENDEGSEP